MSAATARNGAVGSATATAWAEPSGSGWRANRISYGSGCDQLLDLFGEVAGHDRESLDARGRERVKQRDDDRLPVERQDRLRPALRDRPEPRPEPRRHHDGL